MRLSDLVTGYALAALGAVTVHASLALPPMQGQPVGPSAFPIVIGVGLLLCGVLIAHGIGRGFEAQTGSEVVPAHPQKTSAFARTVAPPVLLLLYALFANQVGFVPMAALMVGVMALALGARPRIAGMLAVAVPPIVHLVFARGLRVPLPRGWLPMPW